MEGSVSAATIESTLADILPAATESRQSSDKPSSSEQGRSLAIAEDDYSKAAAGKGMCVGTCTVCWTV